MSSDTLNDLKKAMADGVCHFVVEKGDGSRREIFGTTAGHLIKLAVDEKEFNEAIVKDLEAFMSDQSVGKNTPAYEMTRLYKNIQEFRALTKPKQADIAKSKTKASKGPRIDYINVWDINGQKWVKIDPAKILQRVFA